MPVRNATGIAPRIKPPWRYSRGARFQRARESSGTLENVPHALRRQRGSQPENQAVSEHQEQLKFPSFGAFWEGRFREIKKDSWK